MFTTFLGQLRQDLGTLRIKAFQSEKGSAQTERGCHTQRPSQPFERNSLLENHMKMCTAPKYCHHKQESAAAGPGVGTQRLPHSHPPGDQHLFMHAFV